MAILIDQTKRVLVQGITGREGTARTKLMVEYGTRVVAGCTPGKGGETVHGVPVFDTISEAQESVGAVDISVIFVPAPRVKRAAIEAITSGIKLLVLIPDRVPLYDVLEIVSVAEKQGARFIGPNTVGVLSPGKGILGMVGGRAESAKAWFKPGPVGIVSRSGGMSASTAYYLGQQGIGVSTAVHVGGDAVVGLPLPDVIRLFQDDEETEAVVMFGEIGTSQEERVADLIKQKMFTKPLIAYIGGKAAKSGTRFSHAGAIVEGNRGNYEEKVRRLREVGAYIAESFNDVPLLAKQVLMKRVG